ncbi:Lysine biosynthesis protein LysW [Kitasatospora sp. MMS16-BH015]|uniref:lysine biosynthesis protein LysW n=1 Tax=Kitasatospora sp. MMS16-BH015 TaxID=2018025 RepID=UPI000CA1C61B|nr:lysine biosynthesis protein LysW [Kitasatospora sp. MMS16-BH015]AUG78715.1 Lysine biosynthesis protein LysW [Kitasatospora sp. MMS16-BH015]
MTTLTAQPCPECEEPVSIGASARLNEIVECGGCRSELEIVALDPTVLALAPEVEEDWGE